MRLAVWSGPRNISTALMYSFANRSDFDAVDEPFYASYLYYTGLNHPMRQEILGSQPTDPREVIQTLTDERDFGSLSQYQKHMTQHMLQQGYIVYQLDNRGSNYRGTAFEFPIAKTFSSFFKYVISSA